MHQCDENALKIWKHEYLVAFRERCKLSHKEGTKKAEINNIGMINGEEKNGGTWKVGMISQLYQVKDKVLRAVQVRVGSKFLEIKQLYLPELDCDV